MRKNAVKIQNVKIMEGLSYAEAIKQVKWAEQRHSQENENEQRMQRQNRGIININTITSDKLAFTAFVAEVINCLAQTESRTERIRIIKSKYHKHSGILAETSLKRYSSVCSSA